MSIDLSGMSRKDLVQLKTDVEKAIVQAESQERKNALKAAKEAAAQFGFELDELTGSSKPAGGRRKGAGPKYRNPDNPDQTWSGLGRKPKWMHEALANGVNIDDLEI